MNKKTSKMCLLDFLEEWTSTQIYMTISIVLSVAYYMYYTYNIIRPVVLHCNKNSTYGNFISKTLFPIIKDSYKPTFWCFEARMQTVFASFLRATLPNIHYRREILKLSDGGEVVLDWRDNDKANNNPKTRPTVLFLPGLTGHSQSEYIKSLNNVAMDLGYRGVVFNYRGLGGHKLKTPRTYCASKTEDLSAVINHIKVTYPEAPLLAVGISLGGIKIGNYLASQGEKAKDKLVAAMTVSVCWDPFNSCESLEKTGLNLLLNRHLANCLINSIKEVKHHFDKNDAWNMKDVFSSTTIKEFDSRFTIHQFGYNDVSEYYRDARLVGKLKNIKVPVLALNSLDDPFQPGESIPTSEASVSDKVAILTTEYGGHIGFMEGFLPTRICYSDRVFQQFARAAFQNRDTLKAI